MKWEKDEPETAAYECENCAGLIPHAKKRWMVDRGEWRATAKARQPGLVGFHLWAAYSYSPNASWGQLVREFLDVKSDPDQLRTFINTALGECFEADYANRLDAEGLLARVEDYEPGTCPNGVVLLTAGVDVQGGGGSAGDRLEVSVWGWGRGEEAWLIYHQAIMGDPTQPEVWRQLDEVLSAEWSRLDGQCLKIRQMACDSGGHATHETYLYARERRREGVIATKGSSQKNQPVINKGRAVDVNHRGVIVKNGCQLYSIGTDTVKVTLMGRLRHCQEPGPGFLHFNAGTDREYFDQLTAEKQQIKSVRGFTVKEWTKKSGDRNEALDCLCMAYAALQLLARRYNRQTMWDQLEMQAAGMLPSLPQQQKQGQGPGGQAAGRWLGENSRRSDWLRR